uniref:Spermatogenesis-defective protein 39 homolog n=1 Tax=Hucho hucho TaxID=62062 RepID=A0A4W5P4Q7_9TELE
WRARCREYDAIWDAATLKESKRAVNSIRSLVEEEDEEDDVEKVSWSGEPVGSISWSVKETASSIRSTGEVRDQSFPKINTAPSLPKNSSGYSLSSLFKAFGETSIRNYAPELRKPKSEYKVRYVYSLEKFRSLQDKLLLLDEAVNAHDGNVITAVLIYLKKSLSKENLFRELITREIALRHYIHFLKEIEEQKLLVELFKSLDRTEDMALMQYRDHLNIRDENKRRDFLKSCLSLPFSPDDATHVQDHYTLLERQIIIESSGQADIFKKYPRKASILNMPIITTLYYSCFYHYGESDGTYSSPANIRKTFRISDKQFLLTCLGARAKLKAWFDVDALFTTKNWLGYTKKRSPIGFHRIVDILQKNNAPVQVLQEYVNLVEDAEQKISLAQKYKCHDVIINTYRDLKDRQQLIVYRGKVERGSSEYRKIEEILSNSVR